MTESWQAFRAILDRLHESAERWSEFYAEVDDWADGERGMTQLDHGHEEYAARIELMVALRAFVAHRESVR